MWVSEGATAVAGRDVDKIDEDAESNVPIATVVIYLPATFGELSGNWSEFAAAEIVT